MRALAPWSFLALALLAGCSEAADGTDGPTPAPSVPPDGPPSPAPPAPSGTPPAILDVFNDTVAQPAPGGTASVGFHVPDGYIELFVRATGDVVVLGQVRLVLRGPDGTENVLLDGAYGHDDGGGVVAPGLSCPCEWRAPSQAGTWELDWDVQGELELPLRVSAQ